MESERQLQFDRIGRTLALNKAAALTDLCSLLVKVCENVVKSPTEIKFRTLKMGNDTIKTRILDRSGGLDVLKLLGWQKKGSQLELGSSGENIDDIVTQLQHGISWLNATSAAYADFHQAARGGADDVVAQCQVQLRMPVGREAVRGGFMLDDTLEDVKRFAQSHFVDARRSSVRLSQPRGISFGDAGDASTLRELGFGSRVALTVVAHSEGDTESIFTAAMRRAADGTSAQAESLYERPGSTMPEARASQRAAEARQLEVARERVARASERERALSAFREDREALGPK